MRKGSWLVAWSVLATVVACSGEDADSEAGEPAGPGGPADTSTPGNEPGGSAEPGSGGDGATAGSGAVPGNVSVPGEGSTGPGAGGDSTGGAAPSGGAGGCDGASLMALPADTSLPGPWPVGQKTVTVAGRTVEVWYPAVIGSEAGKDAQGYDPLQWIPESERAKVPPERRGLQPCNCYADLPLDDSHGPYPLVIYIHGTSAFRTTSLGQMTHWASRGFVVAAADHPGLWMLDWLANNGGAACTGTGTPSDYLTNLPAASADVSAMIDAFAAASGELAFLDGVVDASRVGVSGHSAGGVTTASMVNHPAVQVLIPMQGWAPALGQPTGVAAPSAVSMLGLGALDDAIAVWPVLSPQWGLFNLERQRLVGVTGAGHLMVTELCDLTNDQGETILDVGQEVGICGVESVASLFDCRPEHIPVSRQQEIVNHITAATLEETLHCVDRSSAFAEFTTKFPEVGQFMEK